MAMFWFYCDESYNPQTYVVGGFLANEKIWSRVERLWNAKNKRIGVRRFHAAELNARDNDFEGWGKNRQIRYAKDLLRIIKDQKGHMVGITCGILVKEYEKIISVEGREKLGNPYVVCFKHCIALIAESMQKLSKDARFSVILDQNPLQSQAVSMFYAMKDDKTWIHCDRLVTCTPAKSEEIIPLQTADLIAYETFKLIHGRHYGANKIRHSLKSLFGKVYLDGRYFDAEALHAIKPKVEAAKAKPNAMLIVETTSSV